MAAKIIQTKTSLTNIFKRLDELLYEYGNKVL